MSKFPDVIVIVRDKKNFALIGSFQIIGSAKPCKEFLKVGAPVRELVFCLLQNGFTITEQGEVGVFFRTR
ncbi:hypothetical protein J5Y03_11760 [Bacillus sp. RG28]|uniref:Uncharacterized protein n=1 Tax=Gottfriedia endophytica TaxID=2820819 RepID=A0A940NS67_9BACI|nr:hypothetical protein [Gottfriedia endophytica]MBP0725846.1 hypothetical protein [Gottfriedia endophytica]